MATKKIVAAATPSDMLVGFGVGLLIYAVAPPELKAAIRAGLTKARGKVATAPKPVDLAAKYPGAIDV